MFHQPRTSRAPAAHQPHHNSNVAAWLEVVRLDSSASLTTSWLPWRPRTFIDGIANEPLHHTSRTAPAAPAAPPQRYSSASGCSTFAPTACYCQCLRCRKAPHSNQPPHRRIPAGVRTTGHADRNPTAASIQKASTEQPYGLTVKTQDTTTGSRERVCRCKLQAVSCQHGSAATPAPGQVNIER